MDTTNIRSATPDDLTRLADLWQEHMTILGQSDPRFSKYKREDWLKRTQLDDPHMVILVGQTDEAMIAGYILGRVRESYGVVYGVVEEIALDAHTYHAGMGRALWLSLKNWFEDEPTQPIQRTIISVPRYHAVEQAFWRALGATEWKNDPWQTPPEFTWMTL